jgi:hypothetical protein
MKKYDADIEPDSKAWLSMDESEREVLVLRYHKQLGLDFPGLRTHVLFHNIIENQLAEKIPEVVEKLQELTSDGLERHEAIHAIGRVFADLFYYLMKGETSGTDFNKDYHTRLKALTAESWLKLAEEDDDQ